jgi:nitroreductase
MHFSQPVVEIIRKRYSCRTYVKTPIEEAKRSQLLEFLSSVQAGPLGTSARFTLLAASDQDQDALRGLGTYGNIRGASGFLAGAVADAPHNLEDYGFRLEEIILLCTDLGLGTCWVGGTFTKSAFAARIALQAGEVLPAIAAVGNIAPKRSLVDRAMRSSAGSDHRFPWARLFYDGGFGAPLSPEMAGPYAVPLEMLRLAPSASNKQPWRIVREGDAWHFFLKRSAVYGTGGMRLVGVADLQRVDMGIAMCHFGLTAEELGLPGGWQVRAPGIEKPDGLTEYIITWAPD